MRGNWKMLVVALVLWAGCASTPGRPVGGWPDVTCHGGNARAMLDEIVAKAEEKGRPDVAQKALECRDNHTGVSTYHCAKVCAAWSMACKAFDTGNPNDWQTCLEELTHPPNR